MSLGSMTRLTVAIERHSKKRSSARLSIFPRLRFISSISSSIRHLTLHPFCSEGTVDEPKGRKVIDGQGCEEWKEPGARHVWKTCDSLSAGSRILGSFPLISLSPPSPTGRSPAPKERWRRGDKAMRHTAQRIIVPPVFRGSYVVSSSRLCFPVPSHSLHLSLHQVLQLQPCNTLNLLSLSLLFPVPSRRFLSPLSRSLLTSLPPSLRSSRRNGTEQNVEWHDEERA